MAAFISQALRSSKKAQRLCRLSLLESGGGVIELMNIVEGEPKRLKSSQAHLAVVRKFIGLRKVEERIELLRM